MLHTRKPTRHVAWRWETAFFQDTTQKEESSCTWLWAHTSAHCSFWSVFWIAVGWKIVVETGTRKWHQVHGPRTTILRYIYNIYNYIYNYIYISEETEYLTWTELDYTPKCFTSLSIEDPAVSFSMGDWGTANCMSLSCKLFDEKLKTVPQLCKLWDPSLCPFGNQLLFAHLVVSLRSFPGNFGFLIALPVAALVFFSILPALGCPMLSLFASFVHVHLPKYGGRIWWWWSWTLKSLKTDCVHWNLNSLLRWPWWDLWSCASSRLCSPWRRGELCCQDLPSLFLGLAELES